MSDEQLTPLQQRMVATWEAHMAAEFVTPDVDATMATMTAEPFVNHIPTMTGGVGREAVRAFYGAYFLPGNPKDTESRPVARTVGANRIVDELVHCFTHDIEMPWILPGVAPTGKRVEVSVVAIVEFEGDKVSGERIYWDQASVLAQVGLIDATGLPIRGSEASRKALDPASEPSNVLIEQAESKKRQAAA